MPQTRHTISPTSWRSLRPTRPGSANLHGLIEHFGLDAGPRLHAACPGQRGGVRAPRSRTLRGGEFRYPLDNGSEIRVQVRIDREARERTIDFTGTSPQDSGNFNAPLASAAPQYLYVFRALVDDEIPLNGGLSEASPIVVPEGCFLRPRYPAAGNRRQHGDFTVRGRCALRRARSPRVLAGNDEQLRLWQ